MAEAKTTKTKKEKEMITDMSAISPELLAQITKQIEENIKKEEAKTCKRKKSMRVEFDLEELVPVESVFYGIVECKSRTGKSIIWRDHGITQYMTIGDVIDVNSFSEIYFNEPKLIVRDDEVAEYLNTLEINKIADKISNLDDFLKLDLQEINDILNRLPKGLRKNICSELVKMIEEGKINDLRLIKFLGRKLNLNYKLK